MLAFSYFLVTSSNSYFSANFWLMVTVILILWFVTVLLISDFSLYFSNFSLAFFFLSKFSIGLSVTFVPSLKRFQQVIQSAFIPLFEYKLWYKNNK